MSSQPRQQGELIQADFFDNVGGLNTSDSPFRVQDNQAVAGANYDYVVTGGFRKRPGHTCLNSSGVDSVLATLGTYVHTDLTNTKTLLRAAGTKLQTINKTTGASTVVTDDTVSAGTSVFTSSQPVCFSQFNTTSNSITWLAGGGQASAILSGYNGTTFTSNGVTPFAGSITVASGGAGSTSLGTGNYYYAVVAYKASTGSTSNASIDSSVYASTAGNYADIQLSGITAYDTTKYTQIWIYRSVIGGSSAFTSGDLVAKIAYNGSTYTVSSGSGSIVSTSKYRDDGGYISTSTPTPRANNIILDNSVLPAGTYNTVVSYRRRLVTAQASTLYFSDLNKPESWPTNNYIQIPSGGPITALAVINYNTSSVSDVNELLIVFKERECWIVQGSNFTTYTDPNGIITRSADITLIFCDYVGCVAQPLIVNANNFIYWIDYRGVYLWDGSDKPRYCSRPIEYDFTSDGDFDLTNLQYGIGTFLRRQNQVYWVLASKTYGTNKVMLKLDLRLTLPRLDISLSGGMVEGVFAKDTLTYNIYGACSAIISSAEVYYASGNDGMIWTLYDNFNSDNGSAIAFSYRTKPLELGSIATLKRVHKVIAWCQEGNTNNLTLNFWVNYRTLDAYKGTVSEQITTQVTTAVWDQSTWDTAYWDTQYKTYTPVVFNLASPDIGTEGEAFTFEFQQQDLNSPVVIAGFSIIYSTLGVRV